MIEIVVDEVVLRGVPPELAHAVVAAFQERLTALAHADADTIGRLANRADPSERLRLPSEPAADPTELGAAVAQAVWSDITRTTRHEGGAP
ncbi:hypothetical protein [Streptomyces sp. NPDC001652]|uniref:hypothetical protein n=1 Tax=Streptomyces sp. NPDC001652 TaxID=3154393 RepID=UPI00332CDDB0